MNHKQTKPRWASLPHAIRPGRVSTDAAAPGLGSHRRASQPHRRTRGFTLTELLVSTAILSGLILVMFNVVDNASRAWRTTEQRVDAFREARAALFIIARDLSCAINLNARDPNLPAFLLANETRNFDPKDAQISGNTAPPTHAHAAFFFAAMPAQAQDATSGNKSDVCSIGYFVDFARTGLEPEGSYRLKRYFRSSDETFKAISTGTQPLFQGMISDDLLARNAIDFFIKPFRADGTCPAVWDRNEMPAYVEVSLTAFNYATAKQFSQADWRNRAGQTYKEKRQTFTTRIKLNNP